MQFQGEFETSPKSSLYRVKGKQFYTFNVIREGKKKKKKGLLKFILMSLIPGISFGSSLPQHRG